ncbi:sucrase ferredoxin [Gloeocapsopsis crepidinum LEGE 06123]|uniref:Sucrase ferredoxin n=1 Tax=Gloeocapsopsis crepidinum LEGE 06123 TaxID=588587 RepID=A0ABR9UPQ7_9CHRO|nr:sucrase ferredoxin [Gloeocapsopsis crepidinum]MBE9190264.1 sucrase ferredoxin [Gloeocapsopsis crepidinum LEGE 06123]
MTQIDIIKECQICSEVSQANGEDLIGSAGNYDHFLFVEMAEPWARNFVYEHPQLGAIYAMAEDLSQEQVSIRVMAIAPDYKTSNQTRVLHYQRPTQKFARFEKREFLIPHEEMMSLAIALLKQSDELSQFNAYRQQTGHIRDMMLCTHGSYDLACGRFGYPLYRQMRSEYAANCDQLRVWRCTHLGPHNFAPLLVDFPEGRYWGRLKSEILPLLVQRNGSVAELYHFYVGWAGLGWAEQIVEREVWMQEGWDWINYHKTGQTLAIDPSDEDYPNWAEVRIDFTSPDGTISGAYEARIEANRTVKTMWTSGKDQPLWEVKQYHVSRLDKVV